LRSLILVSLATLLLPGGAIAGPLADTAAPPAFGLCQGNVAEIAVVGEPAGFVVHVRLTETAARDFAEMTGHAWGRELSVLAGGEVFSRAVVRAGLDSGRLASTPRARAAADELLRAIRQSRPEAECGVGAGNGAPPQ
jgi:hypothetical protein